MRVSACMKVGAIALLSSAQSSLIAQHSPPQPAAQTIEAQTRAELVAARNAAWRAFFSDDYGKLEDLLGPEVIAIQENQDNWVRRDSLTKLAQSMQKRGVKLTRLEFPHTEIQVFGDVAILYYTYIFGNGVDGRSVTDAGRGTEIFVRRSGRWVDVGWHLDNGAFVQRDGIWQRIEPR